MANIKNSWPSFSKAEINRVAKVLESGKVNYWTGEETKLFEKEYASFLGVEKTIAVANGTLALDLALHGLKVGLFNGGSEEDEVIVTPRSFIASVSTVVNAGAKPIFSDVDVKSGNLSAKNIAKVITEKTKAIIVVHLAGWPCDMEPIMTLAKRANIKVIEDCAQAHGARYKDKNVGTIGDIGVWSFCQDKIMTTGGEGGLVATNCPELWERMWSFKDHGKDWNTISSKKQTTGFKWVHHSIGSNFRLTEMQSAIGRIQLTKLDEWKEKRQSNANFFKNVLMPYAKDQKICLPPVKCDSCNCNIQTSPACTSANYKFYFYVNERLLAVDYNRDKIVEELNERNVPCFQGSCSEIYLEKAFNSDSSFDSKRLPNAQKLGQTSIMLLVHPTLTKEELSDFATEIKVVLDKAFDRVS